MEGLSGSLLATAAVMASVAFAVTSLAGTLSRDAVRPEATEASVTGLELGERSGAGGLESFAGGAAGLSMDFGAASGGGYAGLW